MDPQRIERAWTRRRYAGKGIPSRSPNGWERRFRRRPAKCAKFHADGLMVVGRRGPPVVLGYPSRLRRRNRLDPARLVTAIRD